MGGKPATLYCIQHDRELARIFPCMYGENAASKVRGDDAGGSPVCVRGERTVVFRLHGLLGISRVRTGRTLLHLHQLVRMTAFSFTRTRGESGIATL